MTHSDPFQTLIDRICNIPDPQSLARQRAMNRLLAKLQKLPGLTKTSHPDYPEALDRTWEWVSRDICKFELRSGRSMEAALVTWINGTLYWRIKDLAPIEDYTQYRLDKTMDSSGESKTTQLDLVSETHLGSPTLSGLDGHIERLRQQKIQRVALDLEDYIYTDPEGTLRQSHPRKHSDCNCQFLSQRLLLKEPRDRAATLSRELDINYQTLKSHWEKKCKPLLQSIARDLGYQTE